MVTALISDKPIVSIFTGIPSLPNDEGWAGMYAGESNGALFCFGGVNFPDKKPWEGGKKKWYDDIYMLNNGESWTRLADRLPSTLGYGVSVSYQNEIILIGGNNETGFSDKVFGYKWNGSSLDHRDFPSLPVPLANMAGALVDSHIILAGGSSYLTGEALRKCYLLDLDNVSDGWSEIEAWPGDERVLPACASQNGKFYLFGGETIKSNALGLNYRYILDDSYSLTAYKSHGMWTALWRKLSRMPKGISAIANPLPVLDTGKIVFWGGVDAVRALHSDPITHPGISKDVLLYTIGEDSWAYAGNHGAVEARVTLPVARWNGQWIYISGEVKPGIRTNTVCKIS